MFLDTFMLSLTYINNRKYHVYLYKILLYNYFLKIFSFKEGLNFIKLFFSRRIKISFHISTFLLCYGKNNNVISPNWQGTLSDFCSFIDSYHCMSYMYPITLVHVYVIVSLDYSAISFFTAKDKELFSKISLDLHQKCYRKLQKMSKVFNHNK